MVYRFVFISHYIPISLLSCRPIVRFIVYSPPGWATVQCREGLKKLIFSLNSSFEHNMQFCSIILFLKDTHDPQNMLDKSFDFVGFHCVRKLLTYDPKKQHTRKVQRDIFDLPDYGTTFIFLKTTTVSKVGCNMQCWKNYKFIECRRLTKLQGCKATILVS